MDKGVSIHHRQSLRLKDFDYSQEGLYYITIVVHERRCIFGEIDGEKFFSNQSGKMIMTVPNRKGRHKVCPYNRRRRWSF